MRGLSLIELMVSLTIGLIVTLTITTILVRNEGFQRTTTAVNDASQAGNYAALSIDRMVRSAGSGFGQFRQAFGCLINASTGSGSTTILPKAFPAPFANIGTTSTVPVRLAPVIIVDGGGPNSSDQLMVMSGSHGFSETAMALSPKSTTVATTVVGSTLGLAKDDIVLIADRTPGRGCMVQQLDTIPATSQTLTFAGNYYDSTGSTINLVDFANYPTASLVPLGNIANPPSFNVYGIGDNDNFVGYDMLNATGTGITLLTEGVVAFQALYGIGSPVPGPITWVAPTGSTYGASSTGLLSGTLAAQNTLATIQAVRIAMILRSPVKEKDDISQLSPVMFADLPALAQTFVVGNGVGEASPKYRYRLVETIIPLRNL